MEHAEVLELIDLAALEPGGLERLAAGDTPEAAAVAGHLAGCADCRAELAATARTAAVAADAIRELPDPALKARTLAFVREVGVDRSGRAAAVSADSAPAVPVSPFARSDVASPDSAPPRSPFARPVEPAAAVVAAPAAQAAPVDASPEPLPANVIPMTRRPRRAAWWTAASVAAVIVAGVAGFAAGGARTPSGGEDIVTVMSAAKTTMHIAEQPDAAHFALASTTGDMSGGTVLFSASTGELSMTATNLKAIPAGATYACWVEVDGQRRRIGVLYIEGTDGTWAGWVDGLDKLGQHPVFGVSLVTDAQSTGMPVLRGGSNP
jgi:hypothetical protein